MFKILVIVTSNCEACNIAKSHVLSAAEPYKNISVSIKNRKEVDNVFLRENRIKDFPTVLYIIDNKVVSKSCGTYPTVVYTHWIKMYFDSAMT